MITEAGGKKGKHFVMIMRSPPTGDLLLHFLPYDFHNVCTIWRNIIVITEADRWSFCGLDPGKLRTDSVTSFI